MRYLTVFGVMIIITLLYAVPGAQASRNEHDVIYKFDLTYINDFLINLRRYREQAYDHSMLVTSLQGIVNREAPRLYVRLVTERDMEGDGEERNIDDYWLDVARNELGWLKEREVVTIDSLEDLLDVFTASYKGAVVWDPKVPATVNVACTVAGVEDLLVIRYDLREESLYTQLVLSGKLEVKIWLVNEDGTSIFTGEGVIYDTDIPSTGSAKADVYLWAKARYLDTGLVNPDKMGYYIDGYILNFRLDVPWAYSVANRDYLISQKGFFFDLSPLEDEVPVDDPEQPIGTDFHVLTEILRSSYNLSPDTMVEVCGFVPWAWKYSDWGGRAGGNRDCVTVEWIYAKVLSAFNGYIDGDAIDWTGTGIMANGSFFAHYPLAEVYEQGNKPTIDDLRKKGYVDRRGNVVPKRYIAFYVGDYDGAAWVYQRIPALWEDRARGRVPLTWAINPNLEQRVGFIMDHMRKTATANDLFIAGDSGAGYINPGMLQEPREYSNFPSGTEVWKNHNIPYFQRWDLSGVGFIIDGFAPSMSDEVLQAYAEFAPDGIVAQKLPAQNGVFQGMPYVQMTNTIGYGADFSAGIIAESLGIDSWSGRPKTPQFQVFRGITETPYWYYQVVQQLKSKYSNAEIEVVDLYTLLLLVKLYNE